MAHETDVITKNDKAIARRNARAREEAAKKAAEMKKAKEEKSNSFAEQEGEGYAKGGMVMKSKKSKKPRGSGCAARTKRTKKY